MGNANTDRRDVLQAEGNQQIPAGNVEQRTLHQPRPFTPRHAQRQAVGFSDGEEPDRTPRPYTTRETSTAEFHSAPLSWWPN